MQLGGAHKGASSKSKLFQSLQVYLENKNRLQPIIGLSSIIECVKADTQNREVLYLCEVCVCQLSKADTRNHIMGGLHRYNYIKTKHPHFVAEWKENADLSKLAWPLMEMAKILERREGPGNVQVLEYEEALFDKMASQSENDVGTMLKTLRYGQGQSERGARQWQRIVVPAQKQQRQSKKPISPMINSVSQLGSSLTSPEPAVMSENISNFLDGYSGTKPLIGLHYVVECRNEEDGRPHCFLCHCCRIRTSKRDLFAHLTSSSHLRNYMMEVHPEQVEAAMEDIHENSQLLLALANKVEQEEGRGEIKVVHVPASFCILIGKSYHWCIKMLSSVNGWTGTNIQKRKMAVKGPRANKASNANTQQKCAAVPSKQAETRRDRTKIRKVDTRFKVSLPLTKGLMLLDRTSFSMDSLPASPTYSTSSDTDPIPAPEFQIMESKLDCDSDSDSLAINRPEHTSVCKTSQLQSDFFRADAETAEHVGGEVNFARSLHREVDGDFSDSHSVSQPRERTATKPCQQRIFNNGNQTHEVEERPRHREVGSTQQWYSPTFQSEVGLRMPVQREERQNETGSDATQMPHYYHHQPQQQYTVRDYTSLPTADVGHHGFTGGFAPHGVTNDSYAHSSTIGAARRDWSLEMEQRQPQTSGSTEYSLQPVQTAPQSYTTHHTVYEAIQVDQVVIPEPFYHNGPRRNPEQYLPQPDSRVSESMSHSNAFIPSGTAQGYSINSDLNSRGPSNSFLGAMMSGNVNCTPTAMFPYPYASVNSGNITAPQWDHISAQSTSVPVGSYHSQNVQYLF